MNRFSTRIYFPSPLVGEGGRERSERPGGGYADSVDPPPARASFASSSLRADLLRNARDLPHKGGGEEGLPRPGGERFR